MEFSTLTSLCRLIRSFIVQATTAADSGHPSSALSAVELATTLFFRHLQADLANPQDPANDRFILSKGHASPLLYALYAAAGKLSYEELLTLRKFKSPLEGHPSMRFPFTEVPTGSLGQGLSVAVGMGLALKKLSVVGYQFSKTQPTTHNQQPFLYVLLGDGEMAEGQVWEAIQLASYYHLPNIIGIIDGNGFGQNQETMYGHETASLARRVASFGWRVYEVTDGHDIGQIDQAFLHAREDTQTAQAPAMIIAKTIKGKGISLMEGKASWHGKTLSKEELTTALSDLGEVDINLRGHIKRPEAEVGSKTLEAGNSSDLFPTANFVQPGSSMATRVAYGEALTQLVGKKPNILVLDAELRVSTGAETVRKAFPERFIEMFIAEQNMVSAAFGMAKYGFVPYISTFGSFFTRAYDQLRMGALSGLHIVVGASHNGVTVGPDGPSQMGLEDIALFRSLVGSTVLYPADAVATQVLVSRAYEASGIVYIRTSRPKVPIIYTSTEQFSLGGSKVFPTTISVPAKKQLLIVGAGVTVHEALKAQKDLENQQIPVCVVDCYSIKPIDEQRLRDLAKKSAAILVVEDHYAQGGLGDALLSALAAATHPPVFHLAVRRMPLSGTAEELLDYEGIAAADIAETAVSFWQTYESSSV